MNTTLCFSIFLIKSFKIQTKQDPANRGGWAQKLHFVEEALRREGVSQKSANGLGERSNRGCFCLIPLIRKLQFNEGATCVCGQTRFFEKTLLHGGAACVLYSPVAGALARSNALAFFFNGDASKKIFLNITPQTSFSLARNSLNSGGYIGTYRGELQKSVA